MTKFAIAVLACRLTTTNRPRAPQVDCERVMHLTSIKGTLTCRVGR
jgi:hypothetical protein